MRDFRQGPPRGRDGDAVGGLRPRELAGGLGREKIARGLRPSARADGSRPPASANGSRIPATANGSHLRGTNGRGSLDGAARRLGHLRTRYAWLLVGLALVVITSGIWTEEVLLVVGGVMIAAAAGRLLAPDAERPADRRTDGS